MPVSISVGPPLVTINQGSTFIVTAPDGQIVADVRPSGPRSLLRRLTSLQPS